METIKEIAEKLRDKKLDGVFEGLIEESTPLEVASEEDIQLSEKLFGVTLPDSYKVFLTTFSNGEMFILGAEPLYGVGEHVRSANSAQYLSKNEDKMSYVFPENRYVPLRKLIPFTYGDMYELSNDHWAFMCDKEYPDHDYPVVYVCQSTGHIVWKLKNFEEWLRIFWETNRDRETGFSPVFYALCPNYRERIELVEKEV